MFRIGTEQPMEDPMSMGAAAGMPEQMGEPEMMPEEMAAAEPIKEMGNDGMAMGMVAPEAAKYMGPEMRCESCVHYMEPGSCEVVAGKIDPQGVCMIFTPDTQNPEEAPMGGPVDEAMVPTEPEGDIAY